METRSVLRARTLWLKCGGTLVLVSLAALLLAACSTPQKHAGSTTTSSKPLPAAQPRARTSDLGHSGRWLTNAEGQVVILHGLNMVYKKPPYEPAAAGFGSVAATSLAREGFDVVRLGVIYSAVEPEPGVFSTSYIDSIEKTVEELGADGIYSLLDFHQDQMSTEFGGEGFPSWSVEPNGLPIKRYVFPLGYTSSPALDAAFDNFWNNAAGPGGIGLQFYYAGAWKFVAQHFATNKWVVGYDLFNEPWPAQATATQLSAFYSKVISGIRQVDHEHLIFYEPFVTFDFGTQTTLQSFTDPDLGMSFHDYCYSNAATDPIGCSESEEKVMTNALTRSSSTANALILSEFGATSNLTDLSRVVADADSYLISWTEWSYCGCDDPTGTIPPSIEGLVANPNLPATGSNVDTAKLAILAEPYPRLVSGTPDSFSFDEPSRMMSLSYSTVSPNGKTFPAGSCTAIVVPPSEFPDGYDVTVTGATVTSPKDAGMLTLSEDISGAGTVTVVIKPSTTGTTSEPSLSALSACS